MWPLSAFIRGKARRPKKSGRLLRRWGIVGLVLGPLAPLVLACYPARYRPETMACPQCGRLLWPIRAVACHFCQYRFPSVDVMITRAPTDADSRRELVERDRAWSTESPRRTRPKLLEQLPVVALGHRHVLPDQVNEYVRRLEAVGATVTCRSDVGRRSPGGPRPRSAAPAIPAERETVRVAALDSGDGPGFHGVPGLLLRSA